MKFILPSQCARIHSLLRLSSKFILLTFLGLIVWAPKVQAKEVDTTAARDQRWAQRNSPEVSAATAKHFISTLNLGENFQSSGLSSRLELRPIAKEAQSGQTMKALEDFEDYFYRKLAWPGLYGITAYDVSPVSEGIAGIGDWPAPLWNPKTAPAKVIAAADALLNGKVGKTEIGPPGKVNWYSPLAYGEIPDFQEMTKMRAGDAINAGLASGGVLKPLAHAFVLTKDRKYLDAWRAYMDDWALNATSLDHLHPLFIPDNVVGTSALTFIKMLAAVNAALPKGEHPLPTLTFARVMDRCFMEIPFLNLAYMRSNTHNWTPIPSNMIVSLIGDEFLSSPRIFREVKRRNLEDFNVTQQLRDGTENQQDPWYNNNSYSTLGAVRLMDERMKLPWGDVNWVIEAKTKARWLGEIREHLRDRVTYQIHLRTPDGEWPIPMRGGDKRKANKGSRAISPEAYEDPINQAILAAAGGKKVTLPYHSDWFPYAGYSLIREGWSPSDGYGAMFSSPHPGAYGGYRSRSNNNTFGLAADGQDLIIDDTTGHYMYPSSPIRVDGMDQLFHLKDGIYKVPGIENHKVYMVSAWTKPAPWRWHSSNKFDVVEGIYDGPYAIPGAGATSAKIGAYGKDESFTPGSASASNKGVSHQRIVQYARESGLWIITDRMHSKEPHTYALRWMFPLNPSPSNPAFDAKDFTIDDATQTIITNSTAVFGKKHVPKVNISLFEFSSSPLKFRNKLVPGITRTHMYGRNEVNARWKAEGDSQVVTLIQPRPNGAASLANVHSLSPGNGVVGFETVDAKGQKIQYLSAPNKAVQLKVGPVQAQAESLLLSGNSGIVLGAVKGSNWTVSGNAAIVPFTDFEFSLKNGAFASATPIYRPIDPVVIGPEPDVFVNQTEVTMSSETPGVEIRYTLDVSEPNVRSKLYQGPVPITNRTVVKARAYRKGVTEDPADTSGTQATPISSALFTPEHLKAAVATPGKVQDGLKFEYWQDDWKKLWARGSSLKPAVTATVPALFDLSKIPADNPALGKAPAPREKYYAVKYSGFLDIPKDGVYTFYAPREFIYPDIEAGYDLRLFVGNKKGRGAYASRVVGVNEWYPSTRMHGFGTWSIPLAKGLQPFGLFFLDYRTNAAKFWNKPNKKPFIWEGSTPQILVSGPDLKKQPIPVSWFKY